MSRRCVARRIALVLGVTALVQASHGQTPRTESVLPASTDPAINGWLSAHLVAFSPSIAHRNQLFVYMHGQGGTGTGAMELVKTAAEEGFHAVGLTYPNDWSPFNLCTGDPTCPENLRREILDGTDRTSVINVTRANSVENRLIKLLAYLNTLHAGEGWDQFVVGGQIQWGSVVVWGHSQGGGNAGVLARTQTLARVCLSAPAADGGVGSPAPWWAQHLTPADRYYGFCHTQDQLTTKVAFWDAIGMNAFGGVVDVATNTAPFGGTHKLSTSVEPAIAGQYHNSVIADAVTPRNTDGTPTYKPVWRSMMTVNSTPPTGGSGPTWNDRVFASVATTAGPVDLMMDVYAPTTGTGPRPVLVWIHGGGWQGGDHNQTPGFALDLRARGVAVASIGYRLSQQAIFPAQVVDCKGAIRYLRAHAAEFNIDAARIGVWGSSAGAHLAALVATSGGVGELEGDTGGNLGFSSRVMCAADFYGPTDILNMQLDCGVQALGCSFDHDAPDSPESSLLGVTGAGQGLGWLRANASNPAAPFPEKTHLAFLADPISHVEPTDPPMFIAHGDEDRTVPLNQSTKLFAALMSARVPAINVVAAGFSHGSVGSDISADAGDWMASILLGEITCPGFSVQPTNQSACGRKATFGVLATGTPAPTLRWRYNGIELVDQPGRVSGSATGTLSLQAVTTSDAGVYDCVATNACGEVASVGVILSACTADFVCPSEVDADDLFAFLDLWFAEMGQPAPTPPNAFGSDLNASGSVDADDLFAFLDAWFEEQGACP